jgi:uncharacterized membrane protein
MQNQFEQNNYNNMRQDPENYIWGIFYFNRKDSRIFLPKRYRWMGWTVNFANPYAYLIIIAFIVLAVFI